MPVIDLTYPITAGMPVYPGSPAPEIHPIARFEKNGYRENRLNLCSHTGTHMDAPHHLLHKGKTLDQYPVERFVGPGYCIDVSSLAGNIISKASLQPHLEDVSHGDVVLLRTGWGRFWGTTRYFENFPVLSTEAAHKLAACSLKAVGVDTLSVDPINTADYPVHRTFLENDVLIIENLAHLDQLPVGGFGRLCCLPLSLADADGAPTRVVALI